MKIECIGQNSIKATLTRTDMERYHVTYEELNSQNRATRNLILSILTRAKLQTGFDASSGKLLVEVYPEEDGGCVFSFSILESSKEIGEENPPLVFSFDGIDSLFSSIQASCLYRTQNSYVLMVFPKNGASRTLSQLLLEYAKPLRSGKYTKAYYEEHAKPLIEQQAVSFLAACVNG